MNKRSDEFLTRLRATFKEEAGEHVKALSSGLVELEKASSPEEQVNIIETIFREAHSLKGAARAVNLAEIETICQPLESVLSALKRGEIAWSPGLFDILHKAVDVLGVLLLSIGAAQTVAEKSLTAELVRDLESARKGVPLLSEQETPQAVEGGRAVVPKREARQTLAEGTPAPAETVRISLSKLDSLLREAEELLSTKLAISQRAAELRDVNASLAAWRSEWAKIHPDVRAIEQSLAIDRKRNGQEESDRPLRELIEFLPRANTFVKSLEGRLTLLAQSVERDQRSLGLMVDNLLGNMKKALMLRCSSLLEVFPKFARDLARDQGKEAELVIQGGEIEIDRRILEEMKDPLIHVVRNCIDHGIEKPEDREQKKKAPRGHVTVAIAQKNGNKVEILVSDDGAGVDLAKVRSAALRLAITSPEEADRLGEKEILSLMFQSGVSTSPIITNISGRGLGLAILREKVEKLGGAVSVETRRDAGTTFRIVLPVTLATFRGILVRVGEHILVVPMPNVERVARVGKEEIKTIENRETIPLNGEAVSLVRLGNVLELPRNREAGDPALKAPVVVLSSAGQRIGFLVDEVLNEQEVLVKRLGPQLPRVRNVSGAAVLGTGKVVPILNVPDLMRSAVQAGASRARGEATAPPAREKAKRKSVLVVEDSITARTLLKNILEAAGYAVKTAVDGLDAFTVLRTEPFDLVVSDVDMPRMNGFDLTAKIRAEKKLSEVPLVLVTALESREDRERGIDVGANAYIVKSSFDQSNLLEVIRRLI